MKNPKFSLALFKDERVVDLVRKTEHKKLAVWAIDCIERVLPYFEEKYPEDYRPRKAIETLQTWINTGMLKMAIIRKVSLDAHAAAREIGEDNAARSVARAAGQAVATAHIPTHSMGSAIYALQAIYRATDPYNADSITANEREWQYQRLLTLIENDSNPKMEEELIAPCGMNCGICSAHLASKYDVKSRGIKMPYCPGCRPRDKKCAFLKKRCDLLLQGKVQYCYECDNFPCLRLQHIDKRYRSNFRMSMIDNLEFIKDNGMMTFLRQEADKWKCPECGAELCCHNGICFNCGLDKLARKENRYRWEDA